MKLYLLLIPLPAAMACAPSVSQDEYDGLSADFRQSQTEVSELKSQLNTAESKLTELEGQVTELTDLQVRLRERLAAPASPQTVTEGIEMALRAPLSHDT
jgi:septal ring factor EnvC (AmiA/AmiB activator)